MRVRISVLMRCSRSVDSGSSRAGMRTSMSCSRSSMVYSLTVNTRARPPSTGTSDTARAKVGLALTSSTKQAQAARPPVRPRRRPRPARRRREPVRMAEATAKDSSSGTGVCA